MNYKKIKIQLEKTELPKTPTLKELEQLLSFLYSLFLKPAPNNFTADKDEWSCYWKAKALFEQILYDKHVENRQWIKEAWERATKKNTSLHKFLNRYTKEDIEPVSDKPEDVIEQIYNEMGYAPIVQIPYNDFAIPKILAPYFLWLEAELKNNAYAHFPVIWKMLHASQHTIRKAFFKWFTVLEEKQLVESNFNVHIIQAQEWERFFKRSNFIENTTKKYFEQWIVLLDNPNPVLRGVAAKCIGCVYTDWQDEANDFQGHKHIPITQMLAILYQKQVEGKNVVGGFINGCCIDGSLKNLENHKILKAENFDVKTWVLKTSIDSPETEPYIPGSQAFWFYIHEYLDYDAESCHKLIDGKRYWLAMMCATESLHYGSYKVTQPILERLQQEAPKEIAEETKRQVQIHLKQYTKE